MLQLETENKISRDTKWFISDSKENTQDLQLLLL
jgi:hypothetical protein